MLSDRERRDAEFDCQQVVTRSIHYLDQRNYPAFVALFAPDCAWYRPNGVAHGLEEVKAFLDSRPPHRLVLHSITNLCTTVLDASNARAVYYLIAYGGINSDMPLSLPQPAAAPFSITAYEDHLVRLPSGWRIRHRQGKIYFLLPERASRG